MCEWNFKKFPLFLALQCFLDVILLKENTKNTKMCEWNFKKFPLFLALLYFMNVILLKEHH